MVELTVAAADKIREIMTQEQAEGHGLRVMVQPGGCSGMQYAMDFEKEPSAEDNVVDAHGIRLYIDPMSAPMLKGAKIDYVENEMGVGFKVDNPNAHQGGCSCSSGTC